MEKRLREISRFFVAPRREFAPAVWRVSRTLLYRNTSTSVLSTSKFLVLRLLPHCPGLRRSQHFSGQASPSVKQTTQTLLIEILTRILFKKCIIWSIFYSLSECHSRHSNSFSLSCQRCDPHTRSGCLYKSVLKSRIVHKKNTFTNKCTSSRKIYSNFCFWNSLQVMRP